MVIILFESNLYLSAADSQNGH